MEAFPPSPLSISFVVPVHNEAAVLSDTVLQLLGRQERWNIRRFTLFLVENGSSDNSAEQVFSLAAELSKPARKVIGMSELSHGIGVAYHAGIVAALNSYGASTEHWLVLTAADLPFGFTDIEGFLAIASNSSHCRFYIGSKAHPTSEVWTGWKRMVAHRVFRLLRRAILGMRVGDPQGVIFLRADLAQTLAMQIVSRDFFYTTELAFLAEQAGESITEFSVRYAGEKRPSSVRLVRDGLRMIRQMLELRWR